MQPRIRSLLGALLLLTGPALAQVPSTLPKNTVVGRGNVSAGPPQAIPFATLFSSANVQATSANLTALLALGSTGFPTRTGTDTWTQRSVAGTSNEITVTNGNGVSGNPTISLPSSITLTGKTISGGAFTSGAFNGTLGATTPDSVAGTTGTFSGDFGIGGSSPGFRAAFSGGNRFWFLSGAGIGANAIASAGVGGNVTTTTNAVGEYAFVNTANGGAEKRISSIIGVNDGAINSGAMQIYTYNAGTPAVALNIDHLGNVQLPHYGCSGLMQFDGSGNASCSFGVSGGTITGLSSPANSGDAATKGYVDLTALGLNLLSASRLATAAVLPNTPTYANGASGVGATLTAGSNTTLTVDATVAALNDIILVKDQAAPEQNGQYYVSTVGSGAAAWVLTRCTAAACGVKFDTAATMLKGSYTFVTAGSANVGKSYALSATVTIVGTTAANFALFNTAGSANALSYTAPGTGGVAQAQSRLNQNILWAHDYGAACDGVTVDTTALQHLIDEAQTLKSPARFSGTCVTDSLSFTAGVDFAGTNQMTSVLVPSNTAHDLLSIGTIQAVRLSDFRIDYFSGSGTAITCAGTGSSNSGQANDGSTIENVRVDTAGVSLKVTNCGRLTLKSSYFNQSSVNNVLIDNPVSCDNGDNHFIGNTFIMMAASDSFKVKCGGGQHVIGNKFNNGSSATAVSYSLGLGLTTSSSSAHLFKANSVEGADICFSFSRAAGTGNLFNVVVSGNEMVCRLGINVNVSGGAPWMHTLQASGNSYFGANLANAVYILADGVYGLNAVGGSLWATHAGTIAVFFGSQMAADSLVGGFAKANDGGLGGTWDGSTLHGANSITCASTCY